MSPRVVSIFTFIVFQYKCFCKVIKKLGNKGIMWLERYMPGEKTPVFPLFLGFKFRVSIVAMTVFLRLEYGKCCESVTKK